MNKKKTKKIFFWFLNKNEVWFIRKVKVHLRGEVGGWMRSNTHLKTFLFFCKFSFFFSTESWTQVNCLFTKQALYHLNLFPSPRKPFIVCVCGTGVWTQGLHPKPLHQSFFVMSFF
jgi:hypothetical protein